jgi:hypothetical protein
MKKNMSRLDRIIRIAFAVWWRCCTSPTSSLEHGPSSWASWRSYYLVTSLVGTCPCTLLRDFHTEKILTLNHN